MKNTLLLPAITGIFFLFSCKKDNNTPDNQNHSYPKTYTEDVRSSVLGNSVTTYNLTYDANNRLISTISIPAPPTLKFVYTYAANNSFTLDLYNYGVLNIHEIFWLNASSLVDSTFQYNDTNDSSTEKYIYNSSKQLIQLKNYDYDVSGSALNSTTNYTFDNSGNVTKEDNDLGSTITYVYYTDLLNTLSLGKTFIPQTVNLIKSATTVSGGNSETATHFYTFDSSNRQIKDSIATDVGDLTVIKSYTY